MNPNDKLEAIVAAVSEQWAVTVEELFSRDRSSRVATPRMAAMYLARQDAGPELPLTCEIVGRYFRRDHTTVTHAEQAIQARMDVEPAFREAILSLQGHMQEPCPMI